MMAASILTLAVSGIFILGAHPRLYWGTVGNDLTPALLELPISRNYRHGGWAPAVPFYTGSRSPVSAVRTYDIFNQNGWARSLHFLAAWFLVMTSVFYGIVSILSGHLGRDLLPRALDLTPRQLWQSVMSHKNSTPAPGPPYNALQRLAYTAVVFIALPVMVLTGMTMSPAINAAYPSLSVVFGGSQSARTIHFGVFVLLTLFLVGHIVMVVLSGFKRQLRAMTWGTRS